MKKMFTHLFFVIFLTMLASCGPKYSLNCEVSTTRYSIGIDGESGRAHSTIKTSTDAEVSDGAIAKTTLTLDGTITYEDSGNTYNFLGTIIVDETQESLNYEFTATGGEFGDETQTCEGAKTW